MLPIWEQGPDDIFGEGSVCGARGRDRRSALPLLSYGLIITILMLVISSQAKRTPSRPKPLILLPP